MGKAPNVDFKQIGTQNKQATRKQRCNQRLLIAASILATLSLVMTQQHRTHMHRPTVHCNNHLFTVTDLLKQVWVTELGIERQQLGLTGIVPPSRTKRGCTFHSRARARSARRKSLLSGSASHQSPTDFTLTLITLLLRSLLNSWST